MRAAIAIDGTSVAVIGIMISAATTVSIIIGIVGVVIRIIPVEVMAISIIAIGIIAIVAIRIVATIISIPRSVAPVGIVPEERVVPSPDAIVVPRVVQTAIPTIGTVIPGSMPVPGIYPCVIACPEGGIVREVIVVEAHHPFRQRIILNDQRIGTSHHQRVRIYAFLSTESDDIVGRVVVDNHVLTLHAIILIHTAVTPGMINIRLHTTIVRYLFLRLLL